MKILHLSTGDINGGASKGAYWLHHGLIDNGYDSNMVVARKYSDDPMVTGINFSDRQSWFAPKNLLQRNICKSQRLLDKIALLPYDIKSEHYFSPAWGSLDITNSIARIDPDIINLHWINRGFLKPESLLEFDKPIVWTLRDTWAFTGGCHYPGHCKKYQENCGSCYQLNSNIDNDLSRQLWKRKHKAWKEKNITVVAISHWLAECARQSSIFSQSEIVVIPNALDETKFKPIPKEEAKETLKLPQDKKIIIFGAINATQDKRKGFEYLITALKKLSNNGWAKKAELLVFGASEPQEQSNIGIRSRYLGFLSDEYTLACAYAAADVAVVPSVEEAFGKTAIESMACGTPVVCFNSTGLKDIVEHKKNGYHAKYLDSGDLASGIDWVLQKTEENNLLSLHARATVLDKFTFSKQSRLYAELYNRLLETYKTSN